MQRILIALLPIFVLVVIAVVISGNRDDQSSTAPSGPRTEITEMSPDRVVEIATERTGQAFWLGAPEGNEIIRVDLSEVKPTWTAIGYLGPWMIKRSEQTKDPSLFTFLVMNRTIPDGGYERLRRSLRKQAAVVRKEDGFRVYIPAPDKFGQVRRMIALSDDGETQAMIDSRAFDASPEATRELADRIEFVPAIG